MPTNPPITTSTATATTSTTTESNTDGSSQAAGPEPYSELETILTTTQSLGEDASASTTEQRDDFQESQTDGQQPISERADEQSTGDDRADGVQPQYTTELPTLIQMHNQQQQDQQQRDDQQRERLQENDQARQEMQRRNNAYAFESLEKAFATSVPHKIRATKDLEQPKDSVAVGDQLPWSWAKDIMLQKPVLKKSSQEVV